MALNCVSLWVSEWCVRIHQPLVDQAQGKVDAIQLAAEVGRLDVVSILLSIFGLMFAVIAVGGFWMIRGAAIHAAKDEARKVIQDEARSMFREVGRTQGSSDRDEPSISLSKEDEESIIQESSEVGENGEASGQVQRS